MIGRGEIWWASLPDPIGSEPGYRRPVLVVQSDDFNQSRIAMVIAVTISSNLKLAQAPGNVLLPRRPAGFTQDTVVNMSQVITVDKGLLTDHSSILPSYLLEQVESGLRLVMSL